MVNRRFYLSYEAFSDNEFYFFKNAATYEIYTLSLHDALPISDNHFVRAASAAMKEVFGKETLFIRSGGSIPIEIEEHTSELQSRFDLVCRLLLEKKKNRVRRLR